ncbi:alpha/beta hydrolase [Nakamurella silvestris]|nr:alpha/beta hydrolase [Nakamurella silvestris]
MLRSRRPVRHTAVMVLALLTLVSACTVGPSTRPDLAVYGDDGAPAASVAPEQIARPTGPGGPGQTGEFNGTWSGCPGYIVTKTTGPAPFTVECNQITVPADHFQDRRADFDLIIARGRAAALPADAPELVVLTGTGQLGVGLDGATTIAATLDALPTSITDHFAVIGMDVRGTGQGLAVSCLLGPIQRYMLALNPTAGGSDSLLEVGKQISFACGDKTAPLTTFYNTSAIADDLDSLRAALGTDRLNLLGSGYGATLAGVYVDRYPGRVAHAVLDAPTDHLVPASETAATSAVAYEKALDAFAADCVDGDAPCPLGEDPRAAVTTVMTTVDGLDSRTSAGTVKWLLTLGLPDQRRWPELAATLATADPDTIQRKLSDWMSPEISDWLLITCNDSAERLTSADLQTKMTEAAGAAPVFGEFLVGMTALCSSWPVPEYPLGAVRGNGAPPVLVLGAVNDPVSPYAGVQAVVAQLSSAQLLSWQNSDHGSFPRTRCITDAVDAYLISSTMPGSGLVCPA